MNSIRKTLIVVAVLGIGVFDCKAQQDTIPLSVEVTGGFWTMVPNDGSESRIGDLERFGLFVTYTDWFQMGIGVQRRASEKNYLKYSHLTQDFKYVYGALFVDARFRLVNTKNFNFRADLMFAYNRVMNSRYWLDGVLKESQNWRDDSFRWFFPELSVGPYIDYSIGKRIQLYSQLSLTKTFVSWRGVGRTDVKEDQIQVDSWYVSLLFGVRYNMSWIVR